MGIEGGGSIGSLDKRRLPENPYRKGIEADGKRGVEDSVEGENHWLIDIGVTPEALERIRQDPTHKGLSTEYLLYTLLLAKLIEQGAEWDPQRRNRVRNLVGVHRAVGFPNMTEGEQAALRGLYQATTFSGGQLQYNLTPDIVSDIRWIWKTFGLQVPEQELGRRILEPPNS